MGQAGLQGSIHMGGCHCGAVRFEVVLRDPVALVCNCSICSRKGFLHLIVDPADFTLVQGEEALENYTFGTHTAVHRFCKRCGIHPFYTPRSHPDKVDVNGHCLDDYAADLIQRKTFDGRNWEESIEDLHSS